MDDRKAPEEYFKEHPEDEDEFIEEMARLDAEKGEVDFPEDWPMLSYAEWLKYA